MHPVAASIASRFIVVPAIRGTTRSSSTFGPTFCPLISASSTSSQLTKRLSTKMSSLVNRPATSIASFSTQSSDSSSSGGGIRSWIENRSKQKQHAEYMEQMKRLSEMDKLTMDNYKQELERGLNKWTAKLSFLQTKEVKTAKEVMEVVKALIDVTGGDATADDLLKMDRVERLKVAIATNKTLEEISILVSQIQNMDLMQRTLRKRYEEGKPIPPDPVSMQAVIKKDALAVMTKSQKAMMMKRQASTAKRVMRKK